MMCVCVCVCVDELRTVGAGLLLIGGVVVLVSLIGCAGASGQNRLLLLVVSVSCNLRSNPSSLSTDRK